MDMVARNAVAEYGYFIPMGRFAQACSVIVAIHGKLQKEGAVVTSMRDMIQMPWQDLPARAWHSAPPLERVLIR